MKKKDALRNMIIGLGLVALAVFFTLGSIVYIQLFRTLAR